MFVHRLQTKHRTKENNCDASFAGLTVPKIDREAKRDVYQSPVAGRRGRTSGDQEAGRPGDPEFEFQEVIFDQ